MITLERNTETRIRTMLRNGHNLGMMYLRRRESQWRLALSLRFGDVALGQQYVCWPRKTPEARVMSARDIIIGAILAGEVRTEAHWKALAAEVTRQILAKNAADDAAKFMLGGVKA